MVAMLRRVSNIRHLSTAWLLPHLATIVVVLLSACLNLFRLNEEGYDNVPSIKPRHAS